MKAYYNIEIYHPQIEEWCTLLHFEYMNKSKSDGAWSMLNSFYNRNNSYRLVKVTDETTDVLEEIGQNIVTPS